MNMKVENEMTLPTTKSVMVMLLEPYAGKLARTVLRGESSRKGADLLDNKHKEGKTIQVKSYSNLSLNSAEQIISSIIPWLTIFADKLDFMVLFVCIILQCCFIAIASYNNNNYNLLCSIWGYRYYEVYTEENTYILISGKCIRNKNEIKKFIEVTDYMGLIINEK